MPLFTNQQLQSIISQLDQAIYSHDQWYKNILRVLIVRIPPEAVDLMPDAHRRCRFGQWYESPLADFLNDYAAFISLGAAHEKMHAGARELLQRVTDDLPISLRDWDQFENDLDRMRLEIQALRHEFANASQNRDPLTEAQTRASLLSDLREHHTLVQRGRQTCTLVMLDLDHFKTINDEYGHTVGDAVLVTTVRCIKNMLRSYDRIYRYGGEEFIICMPGTNLEQGHHIADRMREAIADQNISIDKSSQILHVTASFGIAILAETRSVEESIDRADKALYEAKSAGRNKVISEFL